jgi:hypothetical protein
MEGSEFGSETKCSSSSGSAQIIMDLDTGAPKTYRSNVSRSITLLAENRVHCENINIKLSWISRHCLIQWDKKSINQGFGSASGSRSALIWVAGSGSAFKLRIQIRIQEGKMTHKNRKKLRIFMFWSAGCSLSRAEGFSCSKGLLYRGLGIKKLQFLIKKIKIKFPAVNFLQF